jgi:peptidase E
MINILTNWYNFHEKWAFDTLKQYITPAKTVAVMPLAYRHREVHSNKTWQRLYGDAGIKYNDIITPFLTYGISQENITFLNKFDKMQDHTAIVSNADILLFTGGLPENIIRHLNELGLTEAIKNFSGVLIGASAGAMFQLDNYHITPDEDYRRYIPKNAGLSLVSGFDIEVHYTASDVQRQCIAKALADNNVPIYAMWHTSAILIDDGNVQLLGDIDTFH